MLIISLIGKLGRIALLAKWQRIDNLKTQAVISEMPETWSSDDLTMMSIQPFFQEEPEPGYYILERELLLKVHSLVRFVCPITLSEGNYVGSIVTSDGIRKVFDVAPPIPLPPSGPPGYTELTR